MEAMASTEPVDAVSTAASAQSLAAQPRRGPLLRHPVPVFLAATAVWAVAMTSYSNIGHAVIAASMGVVLVVVAATDLESRIIPNRVVVPATAVILVANVAVTPPRAAEFVLAAVIAGVLFLVPNLINRSSLGMGDVKLAAFLGAGLGAKVLSAVTVAFLGIFPFALAIVIRGGLAARKRTLPFGPFLAFGGLVVLIVLGS
jgi:leader peptidase (prepilin peptidase)/N-methyltransferase